MTRRYLLKSEVAAALHRGTTIECFLGRCEHVGLNGVRYISICISDARVVLQVFETQDSRNSGTFDLYEFGPLNPLLEIGEADEVLDFSSLDACLAFVDERWPHSSERFVNEGVIQDEYAEFVNARAI